VQKQQAAFVLRAKHHLPRTDWILATYVTPHDAFRGTAVSYFRRSPLFEVVPGFARLSDQSPLNAVWSHSQAKNACQEIGEHLFCINRH
jgi:hypothetical protein